MTGWDSETAAEALVIGEALIDIVRTADGETRASPGGSPANVAVGLSLLGITTELHTCLGADAHGDVLRSHLTAAGVRLRTAASAAATSTAEARLAADGSADYRFEIGWDPGVISAGPVRLLHAGSLALFLAPGADEVLAALTHVDREMLVSVDPNVRPDLCPGREQTRARFEAAVGHAHLVKLSDEDLEWMYPGASIEGVLAHLLDLGAVLAVVTRGAHGCSVAAPGWTSEYRAPLTTVVDTIGAGDSFMSGLLGAILRTDGDAELREGRARRDRIESWIRTALHSAAITVGRAGAQPPSADELPFEVSGRVLQHDR